jgi:hypothetical protein
MQIEMNDGTNVRFLNGGSLSKAAFDFNYANNIGDHLHVYLSRGLHGFEFLCAERTLSEDERSEAERLVQEKMATEDAEQQELLGRLLANTDGIIEKMQGSISDKNHAPVHVRRAVGFEPRNPLRSWADVKAQITRLKLDSGAVGNDASIQSR